MAKMGDDWMWIGIGLAAVIGAIALFKPVAQTGKGIADASNSASNAFQSGANALAKDFTYFDIGKDFTRIENWFQNWI